MATGTMRYELVLLAVLASCWCRVGCHGQYSWAQGRTEGQVAQVVALQARAAQSQRGLVPRPNRINKVHSPVPKKKPGGNLICYSCKLDFRKRQYVWDHPCLGRHNNFNVSEDFLVTCGPNDTQCKVERMEVNGMLITLKRECTDICYDSCRLRGFGINYELCENCCETDGCNHVYPASHARHSPPPPVLLPWQVLGLACLATLATST